MKSKINVSFLFGAGAEGKGNYDLPSGVDFLENTIYKIQDKEEIMEALKNKFSNSYFQNSNFNYGNYTIDCVKTFFKKYIKTLISNNELDYEKYSDEINCFLLDKDLTEIDIKRKKDYIADDSIKKTCDDIISKFNDAIFGDKSVDLNSNFLNDILEKENNKYILKHGFGVAGLFDDKFHTIINPMKYGKNNFWKVFNYYWFCYFCIVKAIVKNNSCDTDIFAPYYLNGKFVYDLILEDIEKFTNILYDYKCEKTDSYYSLINKIISDDEYKDKINIIGVSTTNYYDFCKNVYNNPIFLNGKLSLFEFPEELEVIDVLEKNNNKNQVSFDGSKLFFPFIFGQLYVKPIVNQKQISEFNRFSDLLNNSDCMVVLGYNLNDDDNHVNAYLHDFVKIGKTLIVVGNEDYGKELVEKKLRISKENIKYCQVVYKKGRNKEIVDKIFSEIIK